ncbi:GCN5-related N-acetyltransferase [Stackebrandtia nassauensis DSM 44728]|uniref:GCN5-related N-acetyltransferase n=1 Tax=Stackebrandtia nassauensis (strain DSM 44728 / CIP 108903 / NRRL B-16338 / NBRC 102104 / LLR-40K-21) TaxID=446470 RepID=D3Q034_STANL|nr:GCN5-related N-acetyltransferase [Stackebrandtia nassauensis DSM 44728]
MTSVFSTPLSDEAVLEPLEPWQAEEFLANIDRCRDLIAPWVGPSFVAADLADARRVTRSYADGQAADGKRLFGIRLNGKLVGGTMFVSFDTKSGVCELGCWLEPAGQGRGLVTAAASTLLDWAFEVRGLSRAEWWTVAGNEPSIKVAKRLGMSLDATLREYDPGRDGGPRRDMLIWSILAREWRAARR